MTGFNLLILIFFTPLCCVDSFITESELQRSQPAPANQTPQSEHSDSIKLHPANQTRLDGQRFHSADHVQVHGMASKGEYRTFSNRISYFSGRPCKVLLTLLQINYINFGQSDVKSMTEYSIFSKTNKRYFDNYWIHS